MVFRFFSRNGTRQLNQRSRKMNKTPEYEGTVQWAKDAPLTTLVDAITERRRYPSVIRDELRARLKKTPGLMITDLLWDQFEKAKSAQEARRENLVKLEDQEAMQEVPGSFLRFLRESKDFWLWAEMGGRTVFSLGAETMWKKCFDPRLTDSPKEKLTDGELRLIETFRNALRDYQIEKEHNFHAFLNDGE
jgi:hypothetical protein